MKRNVLRNLVMVAKGVKNLLGHCGVKVVYHLYLGENKGPSRDLPHHLSFLPLLLFPPFPPFCHPLLLLLLPYSLHTSPLPSRQGSE